MDDFNFDDFLDIIGVEPEEPPPPQTMSHSDIPLPQGVEWAGEDYPYSALVKMPHLTTIAYHITSVELKHVNSKWGNLLILQSHVNDEMKIWQFKDNGKLNNTFATIATVVKHGEAAEAEFWRGSWILLRQTLDYGKFIASKYQTFCRVEDIAQAAGQLEDEDTWREYEETRAASRQMANHIADGLADGYPYDYGDK